MESLLARYRERGDLADLGKLYSFFIPYVYGICLNILATPELAEDAVMEIFERLIKKVPQHEIKNFKSWLHSVSRNHCLEHLRRNRKFKDRDTSLEFMQSMEIAHPEDEVTTDKMIYLKDCMDGLDRHQYRSINLFYLEGHSYDEVAELMKIDKSKVRSYLQNGRRNLKNCIKKRNGQTD